MNRKIALVTYLWIILSLPSLGYSWEGKWDVRAANRENEKTAEKIAERYHLKVLNIGVGTCVDSDNVLFDLSIMCGHFWTIDQARPYIVSIMWEFWLETHSNKIILRHVYELEKMKVRDTQLTANALGLKLAFWDKDVNRPLPPYVSRIIVADGQIRYYMANPKDQSLQDPYVETMEEAIKILQQTPKN